MTTRPSYSSNSRPLSAIFLGSVSSPNNLPDLPEPPPSPGAASNGSGSGLPSPPATNSTGSESTGDDTANFSGVRHRPASFSHLPKSVYSTPPNTNMLNGNYDNEINPRLTNNIKEDYEDDEIENDNEEDNTAKLDRRRSLKTPSENILALQRVKSLTQRNRLALDKLSTISRLSSPSPSLPNNRISRSPVPPPSAGPTSSSSSTTSSHSRISTHLHSHSVSLSHPQPHHPPSPLHYREERDQVLSGSETEREGHQSLSQRLSLAHSTSSSDDLSTPPSSITAASTTVLHMSTSTIPADSSRPRPRRQSLPSSPAKELNRTRERSKEASPGPSRTPRHRLGVSRLDMSPDYDEAGESDLTSAALAAVARSRSPMSLTGSGSGKGKRAALPREFMGRERRSLDGRSTGSSEPQTPHRQPNRENTNVYLARGSPSPKASASTFGHSNQPPPHSPRGPRGTRSSTVRELTRRHQTRWLSEDLSGDLDANDFVSGSGNGRRQNLRSGSTESPLGPVSPGRSLVGEGLRAAGIKTKRGGDDVFGSGSGRATDERSQMSGSGSSRISEGAGPPSMALTKVKILDPRSNDGNDRKANRASYNGMAVRPATSMADYHHGRDRDRQGIGSSIHARQAGPSQPTPPLDRTFTSPFSTTRRHTAMTPLPPGSSSTPGLQHQYTTSEHGRLMLESLQMFESHLSRLPPMGNTTTLMIPEVFRSAQNIVHASDKLNGLLRAGTNGALEEQIDAEVGNTDGAAGGEEIAEVWRRVGGELRESLRISDEIVRTMTGFLLGVGKVLKETAATSGDEAQQHSRNVSFDEEASRTNGASPDVGLANGNGRRSRDGRLSVDSRRSWEQPPRNPDSSVSRRLSTRAEVRPPSALNSRRDGDANLNLEGGRESGSTKTTLSGTVRRLFTPRDKREQHLNSNTVPTTPSDINEPSPTPASRQNRTSLERARTLPPLAMPPPLPSLPSESILRRRGGSNAADKNNRRKPSIASVSTIRGTNPMIPTVSAPTTAITTGDGGPFPLSRNDSTSSSRTNVTFSRPSTISVSALSGLHVQRKRTISTTSSNVEEISTSVQPVTSPLSGSETERDTRRRTIGARATMRMSLDGALHGDRDGLGRGQPTSVVPSTIRKERRRTVNEIFS